MEPFKNIYNSSFFERLIIGLKKVHPAFNAESFMAKMYDGKWEERELKQRMRHISTHLHTHLTPSFETNVKLLVDSIPHLKEQGFKANNLEFIIYPDYLEVYGLNAPEVSVPAMEIMTQFASCEFAIRPFIIQDEAYLLKVLNGWTTHSSEDVRRLASEGSRPRLPWAMAIESFKKNPTPVLPILEALKNDPSEYVRRSVANNLNDISKDHPQRVIDIAKQWLGNTTPTNKLVKHACRTLLKQGDKQVMPLFGFGSVEKVRLNKFQINTPSVKIGEAFEFAFEIENTSSNNELLRVEYAIYYQKANGSLSKKVYKISEKKYAPTSVTRIVRKQPFKIITTRKLHVGLHQVALIINGEEFEKHPFELV